MVLECAGLVPLGVDPRSDYDRQSESAPLKQLQIPKSEAATSKDGAKRKKVNKRAKLKQCKLDARREQWLSQGKIKRIGQQQNGNNGDQVDSREGKNNSQLEQVEMPRRSFSDMESRSSKASIEEEEEDNEGCSSEEINSKTQVPDSSQEEDEEEEGGSSDVEDDWEAAADALNIEESPSKTVKEEIPCISNHLSIDEKTPFSIQEGILKPEYKIKSSSFVNRTPRIGSGRAWRPDDVSRPNTLPKLTKQHTFPSQSCRPSSWGSWNNPSSSSSCVPISCPICYEDLDVTDSNFVPCSCGFRLCLFCHKRIIEQDGRCPGCRKRYVVMDVATKAATSRLPRTCSMRLKA
eukprot:Gb_13480 [translate_table: standard]